LQKKFQTYFAESRSGINIVLFTYRSYRYVTAAYLMPAHSIIHTTSSSPAITYNPMRKLVEASFILKRRWCNPYVV